MSDRIKFVRQTAAYFVASHVDRPDTNKAVEWAEALWAKLSAKGYGDKTNTDTKPRDGKDWYKDLSLHQQKWFCLFWEKFAHKQGRNEAAMRWAQLGELPETEYRTIVDAAKAEAARPLPQGQMRKMAQGWLMERRWEDHAPAPASASPSKPTNPNAEIISALIDKLAYAKQMYKMDVKDAPTWAVEIESITAKLDALRR